MEGYWTVSRLHCNAERLQWSDQQRAGDPAGAGLSVESNGSRVAPHSGSVALVDDLPLVAVVEEEPVDFVSTTCGVAPGVADPPPHADAASPPAATSTTAHRFLRTLVERQLIHVGVKMDVAESEP